MTAEPGKADIFTEPGVMDRDEEDEPEPTAPVTVNLYRRQKVALDQLATTAFENTGKTPSRSELVRAMIDVCMASSADLDHARNESDALEALRNTFKA